MNARGCMERCEADGCRVSVGGWYGEWYVCARVGEWFGGLVDG